MHMNNKAYTQEEKPDVHVVANAVVFIFAMHC